MAVLGALALKAMRLPINLTADLIGFSGAACGGGGARTHWIQLTDGLRGLEATAAGADSSRLILYFHGGGHWLLTPETYREFIGRLSAFTQARVIAVDYRKPPDARFPAGLDDCMSAWRWAAAHHPEAAVAVAGDSSGANLAFALAVRLAQLAEPQPVACLGISPWLRLDLTNKPHDVYGMFCVRLYLGSKGERAVSPEDPLVSPVNAGDDLLRRLPPILMHAGRNELTTEDVKEMAAACQRVQRPAEVQLYPAPHIFQVGPGFPESTRDSLTKIAEFLERHWPSAATLASAAAAGA